MKRLQTTAKSKYTNLGVLIKHMVNNALFGKKASSHFKSAGSQTTENLSLPGTNIQMKFY